MSDSQTSASRVKNTATVSDIKGIIVASAFDVNQFVDDKRDFPELCATYSSFFIRLGNATKRATKSVLKKAAKGPDVSELVLERFADKVSATVFQGDNRDVHVHSYIYLYVPHFHYCRFVSILTRFHIAGKRYRTRLLASGVKVMSCRLGSCFNRV